MWRNRIIQSHKRIIAQKYIHPFKYYKIRQRSLAVLPNLFTLGNAFFGFCSLIFVARDTLWLGAYAIILGGMMDALDGRIARYTGNATSLGLQLDSLCDALSFCVAPAFLMYFWHLHKIGFLGLLGAIFFVLTGIFRLARFNITADVQKTHFLGLPTTIAALTLIVYFLAYFKSSFLLRYHYITFFVTMLLSFLMVSSIAFPTGKYLGKKWYACFAFIGLAGLCIFGFVRVGLYAISFYLLASILLHTYRKIYKIRMSKY